MRNLLTACLPALALFTLGGCAGTSALTSSEDDGVYYSSKDHTTAIVSTAPAPAPTSTDEAANPDYNGSNGTAANSATRQGSGSDQYYDNTYTYMRGVPSYSSATYSAPGVNYYSPYSPYTTLSYGAGYGGYGYSPYGYGGYDPFYSPFYSPFGYGYGSGLSLSFGFGRSFGYGGYGSYYGYGSPYAYGYGGGFYDPYYYGGSYYGGYYGRGGYYGNNYYGSSYSNGYYGNDNGRGHTSGHRTDRASDGRYSAGAGPAAGGVPGTSTSSGGRVRTNDRVAPNSDGQAMPMGTMGGRTRSETATSAAGATPGRASETFNQPQPLNDATRPRYRDMSNQPVGGQLSEANQGQMQPQNADRGRTRTADAMPQSGQMQPAAAQPQDAGGRRRGGFFQDVFSQPRNTGGQATDQSARQRSYDQPQQRSFEQPQQRSYDQPQRSYSQPSYSAPSGGGGGGGGGGHSRGRGN